MTSSDPSPAHGITAAYAVNAVDADERAAVERHLEECADCRTDVREYRETAARLAEAEAVPAEHLWPRIAERVRDLPQLSAEAGSAANGDTVRSIGATRRPRHRLLLAAAAVVVIAAVGASIVLAGMLDSARDDIATLRTQQDKLSALLAAGDTERVDAAMPAASAEVTVFVSRDMGGAMIVVDGLDPAPDGMGYQVWYIDPNGMRSAGMLETNQDGTMTRLCADLDNAVQLGITMEPETGAPSPSKEPMKVDV